MLAGCSVFKHRGYSATSSASCPTSYTLPVIDTAVALPFVAITGMSGYALIKYRDVSPGSEGDVIRGINQVVFGVAIVPAILFAASATVGYVRTHCCRARAGPKGRQP